MHYFPTQFFFQTKRDHTSFPIWWKIQPSLSSHAARKSLTGLKLWKLESKKFSFWPIHILITQIYWWIMQLGKISFLEICQLVLAPSPSVKTQRTTCYLTNRRLFSDEFGKAYKLQNHWQTQQSLMAFSVSLTLSFFRPLTAWSVAYLGTSCYYIFYSLYSDSKMATIIFIILLFAFKLALLASFKIKYSSDFWA